MGVFKSDTAPPAARSFTMGFTKSETAPPAPGSFHEFQGINARVTKVIRESTGFIQANSDKEKTKTRIEKTDEFIANHKEFLKERSVQVKNSILVFSEAASQFDELKKGYELKRDAMANDASLEAIITEGGKKKGFLAKSVTKIVKGKSTKKTWSPHVENYKSDPKNEFGDALDTLKKASMDLSIIEEKLHSLKDDSKLLLAVIQEYNDLILTANSVIDQTLPLIAARRSELKNHEAAVDAELVDKKELKANPTDLFKAILAYKEVRAKIGPQVGAKKKGVCVVM